MSIALPALNKPAAFKYTGEGTFPGGWWAHAKHQQQNTSAISLKRFTKLSMVIYFVMVDAGKQPISLAEA